jgi:hypothetical protein
MKQRGPGPRAWIAIRRRYESAQSVSGIAKRYKTTRQTIRRRAIRDNWTIDSAHLTAQVVRHSATSPQELGRAVRANVVNLATQQALSDKQTVAAISDMTEALSKQTSFVFRLTAIADRLLSDAETGLPTEHVAAVVNICSSISTYTRTVQGIRPGQPSITASSKIIGKKYIIETPAEKAARLRAHEEVS